MSPRTSFLSKLIGLYCILGSLAMAAHRQATMDVVAALFHDASMMFVLGVFTMIGGLAMVLAHNVWSGSARAIIVTVIGWLTLIKGLLFLLLPAGVEAELYFNGLHYDRFFYAYILFALALGAYLTYGGFAPSRK